MPKLDKFDYVIELTGEDFVQSEYCTEEVETNNHLYQCDHHISRTNQVKALETLKEWGRKRKVHTVLLTVFLQHLDAWMRKIDIDTQHRTIYIDPIHTAIGEAVEEQFVIGWENALRGRLGKKWGEAQELADAQQKRRGRSGLIVNLICKLWEQMHTLWKERNEVKYGRTPEEIQQS